MGFVHLRGVLCVRFIPNHVLGGYAFACPGMDGFSVDGMAGWMMDEPCKQVR